MVPLRYSAGMMLGASPFGLYGPDTARAYGHLGFANNFVWADPERAISAALLTTGRIVAHNQRVTVKHGTLKTGIWAHVFTYLFTQIACIPIGCKTIK